MSVQNKLMNNDISSTSCSQELRTEYYNDFDDCLREYKSQNKVVQKEEKVHLSDGSDSQSDTETYVDASSYQSPKSMSSYRTLSK